MIIQYADMRVSPYAITSVEERIADFYKRYEHRPDFDALYPEREEARKAIEEIEKILIIYTSEELKTLTDETLESTIGKLRGYQVYTL